MSRDELIIETIVKQGYLEEIKELIGNDDANDLMVAQFIYDLFKGVECEITLDELVSYYGESH